MNSNIHGVYDEPPPEHTRGFFDSVKTRQWLQDDALKAFDFSLNKIETADHKIRATEIRMDKPGKRFSLAEQKKAVLEKGDLGLAIKAKVELLDKKTGAVLDTKDTTIAHLPYLTDRNTVVYNGSEYVTTTQQRLKPGVYTRLKETGEVEAHVSPKSGTGMMAKLIFDPQKAVFVYQLGTTGIKLYGLLKDLGISDAQMREAWGAEIFDKNRATYDGNEVAKTWAKVFNY